METDPFRAATGLVAAFLKINWRILSAFKTKSTKIVLVYMDQTDLYCLSPMIYLA